MSFHQPPITLQTIVPVHGNFVYRLVTPTKFSPITVPANQNDHGNMDVKYSHYFSKVMQKTFKNISQRSFGYNTLTKH